MSHSRDLEKAIQPTVSSPTSTKSRDEHGDCDGENPEISPPTVDRINDRLVRLSNEHGVCYRSHPVQLR
jgi:hypothetical protein